MSGIGAGKGPRYFDRPGHRAPEGYDGSRYAKPSVACDVVILRFVEGRLEVLLIERARDPYAGYWAFPGGYVDLDEDLPVAAAREVHEETGLRGLCLIELGAFGDPARDPRGRVISIAYLALARARGLKPRAGDDARNTAWHPLSSPPELAFDHFRVIAAARARLAELAITTPAVFDLLPRDFDPDELRRLFAEIFGHGPDPKEFNRWIMSVPSIRPSARVGPDQWKFRLVRQAFHPADYSWLWGPASGPAKSGRRPRARGR